MNKMYEITNVGSAPRSITDAENRIKHVNPGASPLPVLLGERGAQRLRRDAALEVSELDEAPSFHSFQEAVNDPTGNSGFVHGVHSPPVEEPYRDPQKPEEDQVRDLIAEIEGKMSTPFPEFLTRAKALLGDDWPGGTPKKAVIAAALEKRLEEIT